MSKRTIGRVIALAMALVMLTASAFADTYATLRYRDEGESVKQMQLALNALGYSTNGADGKFGPTTEKAVRQFQRDNGLKVDGLAGSGTLTLLYRLQNGGAVQPGTPSGGSGSSTGSGKGLFGGNYDKMEYGSRGNRVAVLQKALNDLGYSAGKADGKFGSGTQKAVVSFQQKNRLTVDGKAGRNTLQKIESLLNSGSAPSVPDNSGNGGADNSGGVDINNGYKIPGRTLRKGYSGDDVKSVQSRLKELGYYTGSVDGNYGTGSMDAVRLFQQQHKLTADGLAGKSTYYILFSDDAEPVRSGMDSGSAGSGYRVPTRTLRDGCYGEDVESVQTRLKELGYYKGIVDGRYGSGSIEAVKAFQKQHKLTADGLAGKGTFAVLFSDNAKRADGSDITQEVPPTSGTYLTLRKGSSGDAVTRLQRELANLNYTVNTNGTYTSETVAAVKAFQQRNGLTADGIAGENTQKKLYSGNCVTGDTALPSLPEGAGKIDPPSKSEIQLLHWQRDIKPTLKSGAKFLVYDPATGLSWTLRLYSPGRHADSEPLTLTDTQVMFKAFGNQNTWNQKPVYVRLPDGRWTIGATHNVPHLSGSIKDNGFDGHLCLHFLRDMAEAEKNDPKYGVANQKTIRELWKKLSGQTLDY